MRQFVTFHIYFSSKHVPKIVSSCVAVWLSARIHFGIDFSFLSFHFHHRKVPKHDKVLSTAYNCTIPPPFSNITSTQLYKTQKKLLYPVNVGRNVARDAAMTHFILASDIELYPNPGLVRKFLEMVARNDDIMKRKNPRWTLNFLATRVFVFRWNNATQSLVYPTLQLFTHLVVFRILF